MVRLSYLLKPRWEIFRRHDLRLRTNPDPVTARRMFKKRLGEARRWQKVRMMCFVGLYFSAIVTTVGTIVAVFWNVSWLEDALGLIGGVVSSVALVFIAGVFTTTRILGYIEVDLYFYSDESRQYRRDAVAPAKSQRAEPPRRSAASATNGDQKDRPRGRRVYTPPPLSSYRP